MGVSASSKFKVTLDKCVDGDTARFVIDGEVKTVRFLAINAPEIAHGGSEAEAYGDEASKYTCDALNNAKSIKLQYDPKSDITDKYDRVLAWVFIDNELLQEKLIRNGLAQVKYVYDDYLYVSDLQALEIKAQEEKIGMWSDNVDESYSIADSILNIISGEFSDHDLLVYSFGILAIIVVSIFCKGASKRKAIKKIKKYANIK